MRTIPGRNRGPGGLASQAGIRISRGGLPTDNPFYASCALDVDLDRLAIEHYRVGKGEGTLDLVAPVTGWGGGDIIRGNF